MGMFGQDWHDFNAAQDGVFRDTQHMIYTLNGAGVTMWDGYAADMARGLCSQFPFFAFQPIGFDAKPAPMKPGLNQGIAEFMHQLTDVHPTGTFVIIAYSEGAIIATDILDKLRDPSSPIAHRYRDLIAVVAFGNPRREAHNVAPGCIDPGGFGIVVPNTVDTPTFWWNFANGPTVPGAGGWDLYATCSGAKPGSVELKDMRDVWNTIYTGNPWSLTKMIARTIFLPWNWVGGFKAAGAAASFFGSGTRPHVDYQTSYPIPNDPRDAWRIGFDYLAGVGASIPARQ
jgi:hypothetical protein